MAIFKFYDIFAEMDAEIDTNDIVITEYHRDGSFSIMENSGLTFGGNDSSELKALMGEPIQTIHVMEHDFDYVISLYINFDEANRLYEEYLGADLNDLIRLSE